jgi:glycine cleavage system H lipoate-binding protein
MWCPFLKEAEVRFCEAAPFRKMIARTPLPSDREHCSSTNFAECRLVVGRPEAVSTRTSCPFLHHSRMLYCNAMPVIRYVPYSDAVASRCQGEAHHYCDTYLALARPQTAGPGTLKNGAGPAAAGTPTSGAAESGGNSPGTSAPRQGSGSRSVPRTTDDSLIPPLPPDYSVLLEPDLHYSPNHMWLDARPDGTCIVGLDAFLARLLGRIDAVTFVTARGVRRPAASLAVRGVDLNLVFPNRLELTGVNLAVRDDPARVVEDPYVRGWLFSGRDAAPAALGAGGAFAGLRTGSEASAWMSTERERATRFAHEWLGRDPGNGSNASGGPRVLNDGGALAGALAQHLDRENLLRLFNAFFELKGIGRES